MFVDELKRQKYDLRANQNCHSPKQKYFPGNYTACANILSVFWGLILVISGGFLSSKRRSIGPSDEENQHHGERHHAKVLLSFCAGHTFIYAFATIPVAFFAVAQLPLCFDLLWAACKKVPLRSYKMFCQ